MTQKIALSFILSLLTIFSYAQLNTAEQCKSPSTFDLYLCIGQSNMAGRGKLTPEVMKPLQKVYLLNDKGQFEPASNPMNRYSTIRKDLSMQALSPSYSFAKKLTELSDHPIGLIVNARGGSSIDSWLKGAKDGYYETTLARVRNAIDQGGTLKAILWHQGETDCADPEAYKSKLMLFVKDMRQDLGMPHLPFIAGELSQWNWTGRKEGTGSFNIMIRNIQSFIPYSAWVSSEGLDCLKDSTDPHFGTKGQLILGERYAKKVWELTSMGKTKVRITRQAEQRARELVAQMTLEEKIDYISGLKSFYIRSIPRLGIPEIRLADGPQGIRNNTKSTLYPCGILSASTWNRELVKDLGRSLGRDAKARGISILLGPGVNIYRSPLCGRNYEYFGEDPYLTSEVASQYIQGVQEEDVIATVKHFAVNNQEWSRHNVSSDVDERTLQEIYFPAFRKAVETAQVGAVMDSYNPVNGVHATENSWLNIDILRKQWGFKGILMSDWSSVYSAVGAANGGLDLEMPTGKFMTKENLIPAIENGIVTEATIDRKVQHILQTLIAFGCFDMPNNSLSVTKDDIQSKETALKLAREGVVLLKNSQQTLPQKKGRTLVLGPNADIIPTGGGSGFVTPFSVASVYDGMCRMIGSKQVELLSDSLLYKDISQQIYTDETFTRQGFKSEYYTTRNLSGKVLRSTMESQIDYSWKYDAPFDGMPTDQFSVRWEGVYRADKNGTIQFQLAGDDGYRLFVNNKLLTGDWGNHSYSTRSAFMEVESGEVYRLRIEYFDNVGEATIKFRAGMMDEKHLTTSLKRARNVIICAGFNSSTEGEGFDRPFALSHGQEFLINKVASLHNNVTVIVNAGGGIDFRNWGKNVQAILMAWYPGQEGGQALAEIITGKISPSGKLPICIEEKWEDNPVLNSYYDNRNVPHKRVQYTEGVFVGYRGYDRSGKKPLYPFGYGLSYSSFEYSNMTVEKSGENCFRISFDIRNTGQTNAAEIAQVYVCDTQSTVPRPFKELKGYEKVYLKKGETKRISITLHKDAFSFYDIHSHQFIIEPGEFKILAGPSSECLPLSTVITL